VNTTHFFVVSSDVVIEYKFLDVVPISHSETLKAPLVFEVVSEVLVRRVDWDAIDRATVRSVSIQILHIGFTRIRCFDICYLFIITF